MATGTNPPTERELPTAARSKETRHIIKRNAVPHASPLAATLNAGAGEGCLMLAEPSSELAKCTQLKGGSGEEGMVAGKGKRSTLESAPCTLPTSWAPTDPAAAAAAAKSQP